MSTFKISHRRFEKRGIYKRYTIKDEDRYCLQMSSSKQRTQLKPTTNPSQTMSMSDTMSR